MKSACESNEIKDMISKINSLTTAKQERLYERLIASGFSSEEIEVIKIAVAARKLFTNVSYHNAAKAAFKETFAPLLYAQFVEQK